jgi:hypothetical protein
MDSARNANETTTPGEGNDPLDPRQAAGLLRETQRAARHQFTYETPLLSLANALIVLVIYGAIWSSSRGHHPYRGPSLGVIGAVYIMVAVIIVVSVTIYVRARAGISGPSRREERITAIPLIASMVGVYVFDGALKYDGFSVAIVYGVFDAAAPWLVVGAVLAGLGAAKEDWWKLGAGIVVIAIGVGSVFAGPVNVWGVLAVSGCLLFLGQAVLRFIWSRPGPTGRTPVLPSSVA